MFVFLVLYMALISFCMAFSKAATGVGDGTTFYLLYFGALYVAADEFHATFGTHDIRVVNMILTARGMFTNGPQAYLARHGIRRDVVIFYGPPLLVMNFIGVMLLMYMESDVLRYSVASVFAVASLAEGCALLFRGHSASVTEITTAHKIGLVVTGAASGFLNGVFGVGGPAQMCFMLWSRIDKSITRGSFTVCGVALFFLKAAVMLSYGVFDLTNWRHYVVLGAMVVAAVPWGTSRTRRCLNKHLRSPCGLCW